MVRAQEPCGIRLVAPARPLRPGAPPEIEIPGRLLFPATTAGAVPAPDSSRGPILEEDSVRAIPECPSPASTLVPVPFSTLACGKFCPTFEGLTLARFRRVASGEVPATLVASLDGPTTNRELSSRSGITGSGSGGTVTALITTSAFGAVIPWPAFTVNTGKVGSEVTFVFGSTGFAEVSDSLGLSMGSVGAGTGGSFGRRVNNESGLDGGGCSNCGATGARMVRCGSITMLDRK